MEAVRKTILRGQSGRREFRWQRDAPRLAQQYSREQETLPLRDFDSLSQKEILALAISLEEEDERIYSDYGESLRKVFPGTAQVFEEMRQEEIGHRRRLIELYKQKFGEHIPLIRRQDVRGFVQRKPIWLNTPLRLEQIRAQVSAMEVETRRFYERAAARAQDASVRQLLDDLGSGRSRSTSSAPLSWRKPSSNRRSARKKTRPNAGSSSCRSCSRGWRD